MYRNGWIKLHRSLLDSAVFANPSLLKVWVWCLCKASHQPHQVLIGNTPVQLEVGQFVFGRDVAANELKMHPSSVYRYMRVLQDVGNLVLKPNNKFTLVTVENWALYQFDDEGLNNKRTTNEQQMNTYKKGKKGKNNKGFARLTELLPGGSAYKPFKEEEWDREDYGIEMPDDIRAKIGGTK